MLVVLLRPHRVDSSMDKRPNGFQDIMKKSVFGRESHSPTRELRRSCSTGLPQRGFLTKPPGSPAILAVEHGSLGDESVNWILVIAHALSERTCIKLHVPTCHSVTHLRRCPVLSLVLTKDRPVVMQEVNIAVSQSICT